MDAWESHFLPKMVIEYHVMPESSAPIKMNVQSNVKALNARG